MNTAMPKDGEIVQVNGHGRAMIVDHTDEGQYLDMPGVESAAMCVWSDEGEEHQEMYDVRHLEVVGSRPRMSGSEIYEWITGRATTAITALVAEGNREMALGALRMWSESVGPLIVNEDHLRLQQLIEQVTPVDA